MSVERRERFRWTARAEAKLRRLYLAGFPKCEMVRQLCITRSALTNRIYKLGLKRNFFRRPWTSREDRLLRAFYADAPTADLVKKLKRAIQAIYRRAGKLGLKKSEAFWAGVTTGRIQPGDSLGVPHRFQRGHVPANKGLRRPGWWAGRMRETQFRKGQRPGNYLPVGTVRANADGYLRRKISDVPGNGHGANDKNWEFVHRRVWEDAHGPIPKGHRIWWKDRNHQNCALENLELLSDAEHMARTTIHNLPKRLKDTLQLAGRLKRRIRSREKQTKRFARPPIRNDRGAEGHRETHGD